MSSRLVRNSVVLVVLAVFGLALLWTYIVESNPTKPYTYSQLLRDASQDKVLSVEQDGTRLSVKLKNTTDPVAVVVPSEFVNVNAEVCEAAGTADLGACSID